MERRRRGKREGRGGARVAGARRQRAQVGCLWESGLYLLPVVRLEHDHSALQNNVEFDRGVKFS
jgi:hypothetical protein